MQIHTPTVVQVGGVDGPPPRVFDMLQYFETILPSVESLHVVAERGFDPRTSGLWAQHALRYSAHVAKDANNKLLK